MDVVASIDVYGIAPGLVGPRDCLRAINAAAMVVDEESPIVVVVNGERRWIDRVVVTREPWVTSIGTDEGDRNVIEIHLDS